MTGLLGAAAVIALLIWSLQRARSARRRPRDLGEIDHDELAAAEQEVRDLDSQANPDEGFAGDDWGPGTGSPTQDRGR